IDVERCALVDELIRRRHERSVAKVAAVERRESKLLDRQSERGLMAPGRLRALDEERPKILRRALDRAELGIEAVDEAARRGRDRQRSEVREQGARNRLARRLRRRAIAREVAG